MICIRLQQDLDVLIASMMATGSELFDRSVGEINVSVEMDSGGTWLCFELIYLRLILACKLPQDWQHRRKMVPGIGVRFGLFEGD
jgi:hypothetical protein